MDRERFSFIAHAELDYAVPFRADVFERLIDVIAPSAGATALDIGCGKAELLMRLAERFGVRCVGVEKSRVALDYARRRLDERRLNALVELRVGDADAVVSALADASFDVVSCIGAKHAIVGRDALEETKRLARPGGHVVWGDGYWKKPPSASYLQRLGGTADECLTHAANVAHGTALGLTPIAAFTASDREWDEYEWSYARSVEQFVASHPDDPDAAAMLDRIRNWRDLVLDEGRDTMGFGLYVFRRS